MSPRSAITVPRMKNASVSEQKTLKAEQRGGVKGPLGDVTSRIPRPTDVGSIAPDGPEEIGRARIGIDNPGKPLGTHAYTVLAGRDSRHPRWSAVGLPGHASESGGAHGDDSVERLRMPKALTSGVYPLLKPGTTLLVTDAPVLEHTTGPALSTIRSGLPESEPTAAVQRRTDTHPDPGAAPVETILVN